jgi:parvulin-like peptidyl-prolyl isomerase
MWTAILCTAGLAAGFAHAQYLPADAYGEYPAAGSTPGFRQAVPGPPQAPVPAARPGTWPASQPGSGGTHVDSAPGYAPHGAEGRHSATHAHPQVARLSDPPAAMDTPHGPARHPDIAQVRPFIGAHVVARVGREVITVSDLLAQVPSVIDRNRGKLPDDLLEAQQEALTRDMTRAIEEAFARQNAPPDQLMIQSEQLRAQMLDQMLKGQIQTLLVFIDAQRNIPEEGMPEVRKQVDDGFQKQVVPGLMKQAKAGSRQELEEFLRSRGSSLDREKRAFFQRTLAEQWVRQYVNPNEEITHEQMLEYYRSHPDEFDRPAQIVWEQLCVQFVDQPSHQEAQAAIAGMGNRVLAGEPFAEVAKDASQGPTASEGGRRAWPDERHLSEELERAIHGLPIGQLSPILRDWRGLHIVRVLERTPAGRLPFEKAQEEIRKKIREERVQKQIDQYVDELTRRTSVWTVLDPPPSDQVASPGIQRR